MFGIKPAAPMIHALNVTKRQELLVLLMATLLACVLFVPSATSKMPGHVHCYKDVCHRVKTIAETDALVGKRLDIKTSHYDSPERDRFNVGKYTSSGEVFDAENAARAASAHFPDGTELLVWNPRNGRASHLRVNDFGPFHTDRTLDVTRAAAERLGFAEYGVVWLQVYVIAAPDAEWPHYELARSYPATEGFLGIVPKDQLGEVVYDLSERIKRKRKALQPIAPDQPAPVPPPILATSTARVPLMRQAKLQIRPTPAANPILDVVSDGGKHLLRYATVGSRAQIFKISVDARPSWVRTRIPPALISAARSTGLFPTYARYTPPPTLAHANVDIAVAEQIRAPFKSALPGVWHGTVASTVGAEATARYAQIPTNTDVATILGFENLPFGDHLTDRGALTQVAAIDQLARRRVATVRGRDLTVEFPALLGPSMFQLAIPALMILLTFLTWFLVGRKEVLVGAPVPVEIPPPPRALGKRLHDIWPLQLQKPQQQRLIDRTMRQHPPPLPQQSTMAKSVASEPGRAREPVFDPRPHSDGDGSSTVIGAGTSIVGQITSASEVVISGSFEGPCTARAVEVAEGGTLKGQVDSVDLVVGGKLTADVQTGHVHVTRTGKIDGDVNYDQLSVEKGGILAARCQRTSEKDDRNQPASGEPDISSA